MSGKLTKLEHPVLEHKLGYLRDEETNSLVFRRCLAELSQYLAFEAMKDQSLEEIDVKTPIAKAKAKRIMEPPVFVSIMRAGNVMLEALLDTFPFGKAGHIGIYRDKFINNTVEYYFKLPENSKGKDILLLDPLIATGDTMVAALDRLKHYQVGKIKVLTIITCPKAVEKVHHFHPDVEIMTIGYDTELDEKGYLVPGIGDAGDRLYKTK